MNRTSYARNAEYWEHSLHRVLTSLQNNILWILLTIALIGTAMLSQAQISVSHVGSYATGSYNTAAAEIVTFDPSSDRIFFVNAQLNEVRALNASNPASPTLAFTIPMGAYGVAANSVVVVPGGIAVAAEASPKTDPGKVVFFDNNGNFLSQVTVGALPDMVTISPNGQKVLVANEAEPNDTYTVDPPGTVSIIDISGGIASVTAANVTTIDFTAYTPAMLPGVRIFGPGATVAQDMEPEYIAVSDDSQKAFVVCQENNAVVRIDLVTNTIEQITSLGMKDHSVAGFGIDASDSPAGLNIATWPVKGLYMPDAIHTYTVAGQTYVVYANEGDAREWGTFIEPRRVGNAGYVLDPGVFPNAATLKQNANLGRLNATIFSGDTDSDGDFDEIHAFGARSFTIRDVNGAIVWDSGDQFEQITSAAYPTNFNSNNSANGSFDTRSDDKGPEPEAVTIAEIGGSFYAFIGLERIGGIMVYDVTVPSAPVFIQYLNNRDFSGDAAAGTALDLGVECIDYVSAADSPDGTALLITGNEISGTVSIFHINVAPPPTPEDIAVWTYEPLQGATATPTPNIGTGSSALVGSMTGATTAAGSTTGCAQASGTNAWQIGTANPGTTNESSGAEFRTSTVGYENITLSYDHRLSNTAARTARIQYTLNGTTWTNLNLDGTNYTSSCSNRGGLDNGRIDASDPIGSNVSDSWGRRTIDFSPIAGADNNPDFGVRILAAHYAATGQFRQANNVGSAATAGTWRIDNVIFAGVETIAPPTEPTKLVITDINGGVDVVEDTPFSLTVQSQDDDNTPQNVDGDTEVTIAYVNGAGGSLSGTINGTILDGTNEVTITGITYDVLDAALQVSASATGLTSGNATFPVVGLPTHLSFVNLPASGNTGAPVANFTVEVRRADESVANDYTSDITIALATGTGSISGTLTQPAVAGVATFSGISFTEVGAKTLSATSGSLNGTSGTITITPPPTFTPGNLAILVAEANANNTTVRIGEIDKTTVGQSTIQTVSVPGTGSNSIRVSGSATSTLYASNSNDGTLLSFTGVNTTASGNVNGSNPRAVVSFGTDGALDIQTTYTGVNGQQTRSATSLDNTTWFIGDQEGFYTNGTTATSPAGNIRSVRAFGGTVYALTSSTTTLSAAVGIISAPVGGTYTALPGLPATVSANQDFYLVSSGANGTAYDVLYLLAATSNTAGTIAKYSLVSGTWTANGSHTTTFGGFGLAAEKFGSGAALFVSTGQGALVANSVRRLEDAAGHNAAINITTNIVLHTTPAGTIIKGVGFAPKPVEEPVTTFTGPSSSQSPYLKPLGAGNTTTSILTVGDMVGGYAMVGIPDGTGAFDNDNNTFTLLVNHELGNTAGIPRAHGSAGAFVSKWVINKGDLSVVSGADLIQTVQLWNGSSFAPGTTAFNRFCSADLPEVSAFYNAGTGKGTQERIFMNGEESGNEGRAFGHIVTGGSAGTSYQLPWLGRFSWENSVACPAAQDKTIVIGLDDTTPGQVYVYVGSKTTTGTDVDRAGLNNGKLFGVKVTGLPLEVNGSAPAPNSPFTLFDLGFVQNTTGNDLNNASNAADVTQFLRPEDGHFDPSNPSDFYFLTTNAFTANSRMWKLHFTDILNPELGGTITAVLEGAEGQKMMDNMCVDQMGHAYIQEDVGNNVHIGKIWQYDIATDAFEQVAYHDSTRFLIGQPNFLTQDEEASGIIDMHDILGKGRFISVVQAHYGTTPELVEGGQLLEFATGDTVETCIPAAIASINGTTNLCGLDTLHLSAAATGTLPISYSWSGTGSFLFGNASASAVVTGAATGTYTLTVSNACGTDNTPSVAVTVDPVVTYYADVDGDGFGDPAVDTLSCTQPVGYVTNSTDDCPALSGVIGSTCDDGDPMTGGDAINANCECAGEPTDCTGVPGGSAQPGTPCDDGNADTAQDTYNTSCDCVGIACTTNLVLAVETDANGAETTWEIREQSTNTVFQSGGPYMNNATLDDNTCLPDGCYYLRVLDAGGDGIVGGGYVLRTEVGKRIIDNRDNFSSGSVSAIAANGAFCLPLGNDRLVTASCDRLDLRRSASGNCSDKLTADNTPNNTSGNVYQFWFFDPNGTLSLVYPSATGVTSNIVAMNQLPTLVEGRLYNVRVRTRISAGVWRPWGPACRMRIDNVAGQCPATQLQNEAGIQLSCGQTKALGNGSPNLVYAKPATRNNANCVSVSANKYQFRFRIPGEGVVIVKSGVSSSPWTYLNMANLVGTPVPSNATLQICRTYEVETRASFDGGATWCAGGSNPYTDLTPWGVVCQVNTSGCSSTMPVLGNGTIMDGAAGSMMLYPNPNRGDQLYIAMTGIEEGVGTVSVDIYDTFGKLVNAHTIATTDGFINTTLELKGTLATGMYVVSITAGGTIHTERLVIQP